MKLFKTWVQNQLGFDIIRISNAKLHKHRIKKEGELELRMMLSDCKKMLKIKKFLELI